MEASMSILIRARGQKAFYRGGQWRTADAGLEAELNRATEAWIERTGGPALAAPDPEIVCAEAIAQMFEGRVLRHVPSRGNQMRHLFLAKRQMKLF